MAGAGGVVEVVRRAGRLLLKRLGEWAGLHALDWRSRPLEKYVGFDEVRMLRVGCGSSVW